MVYPLGVHSPQAFLGEYWQRKPLLIRNAIPQFKSILSADELAGLAMESELESRLVLEQGAGQSWEVRHGPFDASELAALPERDWTLLVQAVDQFVPDVASLRESFSFLPSWRVDDVMISYAVPGGSVGPHYDYYDVFLLQGHGRRRWQLGGRCNSETPLLPRSELMIVQDFVVEQEWVLEPGDMLYLPPGIAHWGTAVDECITYSIGFRTPSVAELLASVAEQALESVPADRRYLDAGLEALDSPRGEIPPQTIETLRALMAGVMADDDLLLKSFGQLMTERRYEQDLIPEGSGGDDLQSLLQAGHQLIRNPGSRFAYSQTNKEPAAATLFVDGETYHCGLSLARLLCSQEALGAKQLKLAGISADEQSLLEQFVECSVLLVDEFTEQQ